MPQFAFNIIDERGRIKIFETAQSEADAKRRLEHRYPTKRVEPNHDIPAFLRDHSASAPLKEKRRAAV